MLTAERKAKDMPTADPETSIWISPEQESWFFPLPLPLPFPAHGTCRMPLAHEKLDVYNLALDFLALADELVEHLPRGRGHLADQLGRASSVDRAQPRRGRRQVLEARQTTLLPDRTRFDEGSAPHVLDVCLRLKLVLTEPHSVGKAMLVKLAKAQEG